MFCGALRAGTFGKRYRLGLAACEIKNEAARKILKNCKQGFNKKNATSRALQQLQTVIEIATRKVGGKVQPLPTREQAPPPIWRTTATSFTRDDENARMRDDLA